MKWIVPLLLLLSLISCSSDKEIASEDGRINLIEQSNQLEKKNQNITIELPDSVMNTDWEQAGGLPFKDIGHLYGGSDLIKKWRRSVGTVVSGAYETSVQPVFSAGKIFTLDAEGLLTAILADEGKILWQKNIAQKDDAANIRGGGIATQAGYLFITMGNGHIYAIDGKDGDIIWEVNNHIPFSAPPTITGGKIYVIDRENRLQALDMKTGRALWDYRGLPFLSAYSHYAAASVIGSVIIAPFSSGELIALDDKTSKAVWSYTLQSKDIYSAHLPKAIAAHPVISKRSVFVSTPSSDFIALDAIKGEKKWSQPLSIDRTPLSAGNMIYVIDLNNRLVAMTKDAGIVVYETQLPQFEDEEDKEDPLYWTSPLMVNDHIITFSNEGLMAKIDAQTGKIKEFKEAPATSIDPIIAGGILYMLAKNGSLYAFE